ncbi:MAG: hypothetical protein CEO19_334 [Parcubacteria group bacterium Gr01-1014_73]|nr:MAG: hypothetical protein CEO19_334 [Parcubacteria group bacterium Gr01-1014_73]
MKFMNYLKIINNTIFAALLLTGAFAGFMIGVKLPSAFASLYSAPATVSVASVISPIVIESIIKPSTVPTVKTTEKTAGQKVETLQLINPPKLVKDVGKPDLAVKILETGVIDKITNVWTATTSLRSIDRIAVRFSVENLGTKETGSWYFNAVLPTYPSHIYSANSQVSLLPGDRIEFTLGFDIVEKKDGNIVVINVDPANSIFEASEENNIARVTIDGVSF